MPLESRPGPETRRHPRLKTARGWSTRGEAEGVDEEAQAFVGRISSRGAWFVAPIGAVVVAWRGRRGPPARAVRVGRLGHQGGRDVVPVAARIGERARGSQGCGWDATAPSAAGCTGRAADGGGWLRSENVGGGRVRSGGVLEWGDHRRPRGGVGGRWVASGAVGSGGRGRGSGRAGPWWRRAAATISAEVRRGVSEWCTRPLARRSISWPCHRRRRRHGCTAYRRQLPLTHPTIKEIAPCRRPSSLIWYSRPTG